MKTRGLIAAFAVMAMSIFSLAPAQAAVGDPTLVYATTPDYSGDIKPLSGANLSGKVAIHLDEGTADISQVVFSLDGKVTRTENTSPYDLSGNGTSGSHMLDTSTLTAGTHVASAKVYTSTGTLDISSSFTTGNVPTTPPPVTGVKLLYSTSADYSAPQNLEGATLSGKVAIFTGSVTGASQVAFYLDGKLVRTEKTAPYDLSGDTSGRSHMLDTATLGSGTHTVKAAVSTSNGVVETSASFNVGAATPQPEPQPVTLAKLRYSTSADYSSPKTLDEANVSGKIAVFVGDVTNVSQIAFYLDGTLSRTEKTAPYDFSGDSGGRSYLFDTSTIANGSHMIRADVTSTSGTKSSLGAIFTVSNAVTPPPPATTKTLTVSGNSFKLNGEPFDMWGIRTASATYTQAKTDELIAQLDTYKAHGVNTVAVYYMGSRNANYNPFSSDGKTIDAGHQARMEQIIKAADARGMVVIVGIFYQAAPFKFTTATAVREATRTVATKLKPYRNVIINIANEQNSSEYGDSAGVFDIRNPSRIIELLEIVHSVDPERVAGGGGYDRAKNITIGKSSQANVLLFDTGYREDRVQLRPYREYQAAGITKPMVNVEQFGGYTNQFQAGIFSYELKQEYTNEIASAQAEPGLYTFFHNGPWLQVLPMRYDIGGDGYAGSPGIRWYFEAVRSARGM